MPSNTDETADHNKINRFTLFFTAVCALSGLTAALGLQNNAVKIRIWGTSASLLKHHTPTLLASEAFRAFQFLILSGILAWAALAIQSVLKHLNASQQNQHSTVSQSTNVPALNIILLKVFLIFQVFFLTLLAIMTLVFQNTHSGAVTSRFIWTNLILNLLFEPITATGVLFLLARYSSAAGIRMQEALKYIGLHKGQGIKEIGAGLGCLLLTLPLLIAADLLNKVLTHNAKSPANPIETILVHTHGAPMLLVVFFTACIAAPIVEELLLRGLLFTALRNHLGAGWAILVSGLIFSLLHPTLPNSLLSIWTIGCMLALLRHRRGTLLPGMIMHGCYNATLLLLVLAGR